MSFKDRLSRSFSRWVTQMRKYAAAVVLVSIALTAVSVWYSVSHFAITTDVNELVSQEQPYRKLSTELSNAFPQLKNNMLVVIDAETEELALTAHDALTQRLREETGHFELVYQPGGGEFFSKNGLLYLDIEELEDLADSLADVQPLLGRIARDMSLRGVFSILEEVVDEDNEAEVPEARLSLLFDRLAGAASSILEGRPYHFSWRQIMSDEDNGEEDEHRRFIVLKTKVDYEDIGSLDAPVQAVKAAASELGYGGQSGVTVRLTGDAVLSWQNLLTIRKSMGLAAAITLVLVSITLAIGLRSIRLIVASIATLIMGLAWTFGFAMLFVGHLNLISITFAVLFIGLGIDSSIQFSLRYRELVREGAAQEEALAGTAGGVGVTILLCAITTAFGFYAFVPTDYVGVSELGLIAGSGMFINFFANMTVLPALLSLMPLGKTGGPEQPLKSTLVSLPYRRPGFITAATFVLALAAIAVVPRTYFDFNPLNLYEQEAEAVVTSKELFDDPKTSPWKASVLSPDKKTAEETVRRLKDLDVVDEAITVEDYVPGGQEDKLFVISDMAFFLPDTYEGFEAEETSLSEDAGAMRAFREKLEARLARKPVPGYAREGKRLSEALGGLFVETQNDGASAERKFAALTETLIAPLRIVLDRLEMSLQAEEFGLSGLPPDLRNRFVTPDGRYRVQVFPAENIDDIRALKRFVDSVSSVEPGATGSPVVILGTGRTIINSFYQATVLAFVFVVIVLAIALRKPKDIALIIMPLALAVLFTSAASAVLGIPFNYANIIVVPLLLGVGVDNGIHIVHRYRTEPPADGNMLRTSTARAVLFSSLTTIMSFSSLSISAHRGTASMGMLLTICMLFLIFMTLLFLPSALSLMEARSQKEDL